jgi:hypothetical protein
MGGEHDARDGQENSVEAAGARGARDLPAGERQVRSLSPACSDQVGNLTKT